jgi:hypothetical protein
VSEFLGYRLGEDYMSIASKWLHSEKHYCVNIISTTVLRGVWLMRNDLVFGRQGWSDVKSILGKIPRLILEWKCIFKEAEMENLTKWSTFLEQQIRELLKIVNA